MKMDSGVSHLTVVHVILWINPNKINSKLGRRPVLRRRLKTEKVFSISSFSLIELKLSSSHFSGWSLAGEEPLAGF